MGDLILVADSHLNAEDAETDRFVRFLRDVGRSAEKLLLLGDIFDLWIALRKLELPFHRMVVEALDEVARSGIEVIYLEGNRDYFVGERYQDGPFTRVIPDAAILQHGGNRVHVSHGDLVNLRDRQYQRWRWLSRSAGMRLAFGALPAAPAGRLSSYLERRFRTTNAQYRIRFPAEQAAGYAEQAFRSGADMLVMGHFHEERVMEFPGGEGHGGGRLFVLPGWREDHRYLRVPAAGEPRFEPFGS